MIKRGLMLITILSLLFTAGCWDLREINAAFISTGVGIDLSDDKKLSFSALFIQPQPPGESAVADMQTALITADHYGAAIAARSMMLSLSRVPEWAHVNTMILGEKLVRTDLSLVADFMVRNHQFRPDINLLVCVQTTPEKILSSRLPQVANLGIGLKDLLNLNQKLNIYIPITMDEFTYKLRTPGIEPAVPQITLADAEIPNQSGDKNSTKTDKRKITLNGTAVFKGNKMVGSLNKTESLGYRWLNSGKGIGGFIVITSPLNNEQLITLQVASCKSKTKPQISGDNIKMNIEITADLKLAEQTGNEPLTPATAKAIEQAAGFEFKRQIISCINQSQELKSDILGWGRTVQIHQPGEWQSIEADWPEIFPAIDSNITVKTKISNTFLTGKSFEFK